jgi:hypothetical protein
MKELNPDINLDTTIVVEKQVRSERIFHKLKPHKGHTCYEFDLNDQLMRVAIVDEVTSDIKGAVHKKVRMRPSCLYCTALNFSNADKRFAKMIANLVKL